MVRNNRKYYDSANKPNWDNILNEAINGYDRKEVVPYAPLGATKPDGTPDETCTETNYYKGDKLLASVYDVKSKDSNHMSIETPNANYFDWDRDGKIDCRDTDQVYKKETLSLEKQNTLRQYGNNRPIVNGILISKIINSHPEITMLDIEEYNRSYVQSYINSPKPFSMEM